MSNKEISNEIKSILGENFYVYVRNILPAAIMVKNIDKDLDPIIFNINNNEIEFINSGDKNSESLILANKDAIIKLFEK